METHILDRVFVLPEPPYSQADKDGMAKLLYEHVWQQSMGQSTEISSQAL